MEYSVDRQLQRQAFFEQYRDRFSWFDLETPRSDHAGDKVYACYDAVPISTEQIQRIKQAAADCWKVLVAVGDVVRSRSDSELVELGYFPETFDLLRETTQPPWIARCDFAVTSNGIFLLECNAEVATFLVETFEMNGLIATHFGLDDPNDHSIALLKQELNAYLDRIIPEVLGKLPEDALIVFSAIGDAEEDMGTAQYLCQLCNYPAEVVPIEQLELDETGVYTPNGKQIDVIYRVYPTEWMLLDRDPITHVSLWEILEPLIFDRKVALINPVSSMVLQNKSLLAMVTTLAQEGQLSPEHQAIVDRHFLPTTLDETAIVPPYVSKPTFGREGSEVCIVDDVKEKAELFNPSAEYASFQKVHQKYVALPSIELNGERYTFQLSCFVINGKATGIAARIGDRVIANHSYFLAIGLAEEAIEQIPEI